VDGKTWERRAFPANSETKANDRARSAHRAAKSELAQVRAHHNLSITAGSACVNSLSSGGLPARRRLHLCDRSGVPYGLGGLDRHPYAPRRADSCALPNPGSRISLVDGLQTPIGWAVVMERTHLPASAR
jgi:hypothetical protein